MGSCPSLCAPNRLRSGFWTTSVMVRSTRVLSGWRGSAVQEAQDVVGDRLGLLEASLPRPPFPVLGVEDAVMRLNPASTNLVEIRAKRT
jgi:hypothetical protein